MRFKYQSYWKPAIVISKHSTPHSYIIQTSDGTILRRNRHHLKKTLEQPPLGASYDNDDDDTNIPQEVDTFDNTNNTINTTETSLPVAPPLERRSRYGRVIKPPARYSDD